MVGLWQPGFTTHHGSLRISHMMWNLNRNGVMVYPQRDRDDSWRWIERQLGPHLVSQVDGQRLKQSEKQLSRIKSVLGCQQSLSKCDWSPQQSSHDSHLSSASLQKPQAQGKQEKTNNLSQSLWHFPNIRGQAHTTPVFGYPCTTQFVPPEIQRSTGTFDQWFSRISCSFMFFPSSCAKSSSSWFSVAEVPIVPVNSPSLPAKSLCSEKTHSPPSFLKISSRLQPVKSMFHHFSLLLVSHTLFTLWC